ncbi:MAG: CCA tRNA nucleotidyltransferase [Deltaproteobacteria bacterium]|nr:CCA tRNA nucleotidyltransferase [Deltaproteobacteria bacterium]
MKALNHFFENNSFFLTCLQKARQGQECFLVGGALRDALLGRKCADYDLITPGDPTVLACHYAEQTGGSWFILDPERRHSRVVCKNPQGNLSIDFAPFRCADLEADLRDRDYTINAMALPLHSSDSQIFDPLSGLSDLRNGILRSCSDNSFANDPLRLLRGIRLALQFDMEIETHTLFLMKNTVDLINQVAAERINKELGRIFSLDMASQAVYVMEELGLNRPLWGDAGLHGSIARGALWIEKFCALLLTLGRGNIDKTLSECLEEGFSRAALIKLGLFLRGYDPSEFNHLLKKLRFARKSRRLLDDLYHLSESLFCDWQKLRCGERGRALWVESFGNYPLEMLLSLAALKAPEPLGAVRFISETWGNFLQHKKDNQLRDLVEAKTLLREGINEESLSSVLKAIRREEIAGRVHNVDEALNFVRRQRKRD